MVEEKNMKPERTKWDRRKNEAFNLLKQFHSSWDDNYKAVYGDDILTDGVRSGDDSSVSTDKKKPYKFDLLLAYLRTEIPSLVLYRPEIFLTATEAYILENPEGEKIAKKYQDELNALLNDMDGFENEIKAILADAHCAFGVSKVTAEPKFQEKASEQVGLDPETFDPIYSPDEELTDVTFDIRRVDPKKYGISDRCKNDPSKADWKGEEIDRTLDELVNSGLYDSKALDKLRESLKQTDKDDWEIYLKITEMYDRINRKLLVICDEYKDDFLRYDDTPEGMVDGDPYCELKFTEIPGQFVPKPEIGSGVQLQDDQRDIRQWLKNMAKRSVPKLGHKPQVSEESKLKLVDGLSEVLELNNEGDVFIVNNDLKIGTAPRDFMEVSTRDFDQVMGQSSQDRGLTGEAKFATEAEIAEAQGKIRETDKLNTVRIWLERNVEKLLQLMQHSGYAQLKGLPINVDFNIEVDIESKSPKNKALDRKQLTEVLSLIAQNPLFLQSPTLMDQIFRDYDIREKQKIIEELQAAAQAQQQAQMEASQPVPAAPEKKGMNVSLSLKHELLPTEAVDRIVDLIMQEDIPMTGAALSQPPDQAGSPSAPQPDLSQDVGAGTGGMEPGSGMMPSGELV